MATVAELEDALRNADAAGDTEAANALADELVRMQSQPREQAGPPKPELPPAGFGDRLQALGSGINPGLVSAFTLPTEVGANVADIGSALLGAGYLGADKINRAFGGDGVDIPAFIGPVDRSKYLGTQANTELQLNKIGVATQPRRPDDPASRYLNVAGRLAGGILSGGIYNKLPIPSGVTPRPGAPPPTAAPPGTPLGGPAGAPPPSNAAPLGTPPGGIPPRGPGPLGPGSTPPPLPPAGAPGGAALPPPVGLNATEQATLAAGERLGLKVTPGVRAGSPTLRRVEARLESQPSTATPFDDIKANNARVIQQQFLRAIGEKGDEVSSTALANASDRIGKVFDDAAASNKIAYDNDLQDSLARIGQRAALELTEAEAPLIQRQLNEILNKAANNGGVIDGPAFQNIYASLGRLSKGNIGSVKDLAGDVRDSLHEALIRSAGPKAAETLRTARDQYRVLITAERSGALAPEAGKVKAVQLANAFARNDKGGFLRGYNESGLYDALRFARSPSFGPIVGDSGTATRLGGIPDLTQSLKLLTGNLATRGYIAAGNTGPGGAALNAGVRAGTATDEIVREMLRIPKYNAVPTIIGLDAAEDGLRRPGLYQ